MVQEGIFKMRTTITENLVFEIKTDPVKKQRALRKIRSFINEIKLNPDDNNARFTLAYYYILTEYFEKIVEQYNASSLRSVSAANAKQSSPM